MGARASERGYWWGGAAVVALAAAGFVAANLDTLASAAALTVNTFRFLHARPGTLSVETAPDAAGVAFGPHATDGGQDWPSADRTLRADRFAPQTEITPANAGDLQVLCTYDTDEYGGFAARLIEVEGALLFASADDAFSIDAASCQENWRVHDESAPAAPRALDRGVAYLDHRVFRATPDGRVIAYDFATGQKLWEREIANGPNAPGAPIAWNGLVFVGDAEGRTFALDAASGELRWTLAARGEPTAPLALDPVSGRLYAPGGVVLDARTGARRPAAPVGTAALRFATANGDGVAAVDPDSGRWRWRARSNFAVRSDVTVTAGGIALFGDMGGYLYALDAGKGAKLWGEKIGGALGGGVISYDAGAGQRIAAATGLTTVLWPTETTTAKVSVLGLPPKR